MDVNVLLSSLNKMAHPKVAVIGDLILDEYIVGEVKRISREAPVPIVEQKERSYTPGGAANTLANLAALQARTTALGVVGNDAQGKTLLDLLNQAQINTDGVAIDRLLPTTTKTRIAAHSRQSVTQQVLRLDMLPQAPLSLSSVESLKRVMEDLIPKSAVVIVSDYGNGVIIPAVIEHCRRLCEEFRTPWIVDSQEDLRHFQGATLLTPNKPEAEQTLGYLIKDEPTLMRAGRELLEQTKAEAVLITKGDEGMSLFLQDGTDFHVPALNRTEVFDVTGAGDTVVATMAVALASGIHMSQAMQLANLAASIVVRRLGASTTTVAEMRETLAGGESHAG